ncbi:MAG: hypothetical protein RL065_416, partial [Bacteroidota bacterium]
GSCMLKIKLIDIAENHVVLLKSATKVEPSDEFISQLKTLPIMNVKVNMN